MSATAVVSAPPLREIIAEIYEPGTETRQLAESAMDIAAEEQNREACVQGWQDIIRRYEASQWKPSVRSGHNNGSGRYSESVAAVGHGLLNKRVALNNGTHYALGEITLDVAKALKGEYRSRAQDNAAGEKFFAMIEKTMDTEGLKEASEIGVERLEGFRTKAGYRE